MRNCRFRASGGHFNPRTREGCDSCVFPLFRAELISIHAPVKGATRRDTVSRHVPGISIHAPVKGATPTTTCQRTARGNFNPRTREGCDLDDDIKDIGIPFISIHAPVKGATQPCFPNKAGRIISIHAPVKGATLLIKLKRTTTLHFNPRTREGCDYAFSP